MAKYKRFEIMFFSEPTIEHFKHYWDKAQEKRVGYDRFVTLWFDAYREFKERLAIEQFRKHQFEMAQLVVEKGETPAARNQGRKFLNKAAKHWEKETGVDFPILKLEVEA